MNQKTITYVGAGLIVLLLLGLIFTFGMNSRNKKNLRDEKILSEARLFDRQKLEGNVEKLKADLSELKQKSDANAKLLSESNLKISENQKRINALSGENRNLRSNKQELTDLKKAKSELDMDFARLKSENEKLSAQSRDLQNSLNAMEEEKKNLALQLDQAHAYNTDNFMVTATRGKKTEKLVICASRAKKLNMAFEVPQSLNENISFKIVTPAGTTINPDDKAVFWFFPLDSRTLTASLSAVTGEFVQSRQVVLTYAPKSKLVKGEYRIQILSNGNNIGNSRLMLK